MIGDIKRLIISLSVSVLFIMPAKSVDAKVKFASIFTDNMVLQANKKITIWGTAGLKESVIIKINGLSTEARAGIDGKWTVELPAMPYGGPFELVGFGDDTTTIKNVMLGEVWICAGQSNMRMTVNRVLNADEEIKKAKYKNIRFFTLPQKGSVIPLEYADAKWEVCSPATISTKTSTGYFFGRELNQQLNVAIGLVDISYGGASILTFMDQATIENCADTGFIHKRTKDSEGRFENLIRKWEDGNREGSRPNLKPQHLPSYCFNAMVNPIVPYSSRGIIWYQGESDAIFPEKYVDWFGDYMEMMRNKFSDPLMPVYFVQLAGFENQDDTNLASETWAKFRLAQQACLKYPHTGMVTAIDIGLKDDIHPKNKQDVGRRLALCALNKTYDKKELICQGPEIESADKNGSMLILKFKNCYGGLVNKGKGKIVQGFSAILADGGIVKLEGMITSENTVSLTAGNIQQLRYGYSNFPICQLYNGLGLPALPFDIEIE